MTVTTEQFDLIVATPLPASSRLGIVIGQEGIRQIDILPAGVALRPACDAVTHQCEEVLKSYFRDASEPRVLQLDPVGTPFQQRVWSCMREIPLGATCSYGELARELGSGARAVAAACRSNPVPLLIPCHRVVARNGLGGYMGATAGEALSIKRWLLQHEGALR